MKPGVDGSLTALAGPWRFQPAALWVALRAYSQVCFTQVFLHWKEQSHWKQGTQEGRGISSSVYHTWLALIWGLR